VKLVYPSFSLQDIPYREELKKYCISVSTVYINPLYAKIRCLFGIFSKYPFTNFYFYSEEINKIVSNEDFDLAIVDCSSMSQYLLDIDKPKIVDFVDIDYEKWQIYAERIFFPKNLIYRTECRRLKKYENKISEVFNYSVVISEREKKLLSKVSNVEVVKNGVDTKKFLPMEKRDKNTIIFSGAMNYFANVDGVLYFHEEILPLIKKQVANVKFIIAGMQPIKKIRRLASEDVLVTGYVPNMRNYVARAAVFVAPLRIAKGLQNKVLEAMAMEVPVVATSVTNRGIGALDHKEILIADDPVEFAQATVALLKDIALQKKIITNAKQFVLRNYHWETNLAKFDEMIEQLTHPILQTVSH
jgi:sugar transferase (PEP-CTERM/EpsH1 system associated)